MADNSIYQTVGQYAPAEGPFTDILQKGLHPAQNQQPQQPYGGGNRYGVIAMLGDKALQGIQKGRLMGYLAREAKVAQQYNAGLSEFDTKMNEVQNDPTLGPEDKQIRLHKLTQDRLAYVAGHFNQAMDHATGQGEQGKGQKQQKPKKTGIKGKLEEPVHIGEKIGGVLRNVMTQMAGPNLPQSRPVDLDWVKARVSDIDDMPSMAKAKAEEGWNSMIQSLTDKLGRKPYNEEITSSPEFGKVAERYATAYPSGVGESIFNTRMKGYPTEAGAITLEEQKDITKNYLDIRNAVREAQTVHDQQKGAPGGTQQQGPTIYNPQTGTVQPLGGGERTGPPGTPPPVQEAPKSEAAQVASRFNSPDLEPYFGAEIPIDPRLPGLKNNIVYAYKEKPDGRREVIGLNNPVPGLLLEAGTGRMFFEADARQGGWKLSASTPRDPSREPDPKTGRMEVGGKMYQTQWDRNKGQFVMSTIDVGGKTQYIPLGQVPGMSQNTRFAMTQVQQIVKQGKDDKLRIGGQLNQARKDLQQAKDGAGTYKDMSTEQRTDYMKGRQAEIDRLQQEYDNIDPFTKQRLEILRNGLQADYLDIAIQGQYPDEQTAPAGDQGANAAGWADQNAQGWAQTQ